MIGLPMDIRPVFPKDQQVVLLTAQAAQAPELMTDIGSNCKADGMW